MIGYIAILGTSLAAFAGAPLLGALPGTLMLLCLSIIDQRRLTANFAELDAGHVLSWAAYQSAGYAMSAAAAAYLVGLSARFISGL